MEKKENNKISTSLLLHPSAELQNAGGLSIAVIVVIQGKKRVKQLWLCGEILSTLMPWAEGLE